MLVEALVLGIVVGWLRGGSLKNLTNLELPWWPLLVIALPVQPAADHLAGYLGREALIPWAGWALIISYVLVIIFCLLNFRQAGMPIALLGVLANLLAVAANGGAMPVDPALLSPARAETLQQAVTHVYLDSSTRLVFLTDVIGGWQPPALSIGDILLSLGVLVLIQAGMRQRYIHKLTSLKF